MKPVYIISQEQYGILIAQLGVIEYSTTHLSKPTEYYALEIVRALARIKKEVLEDENK